MTKRSRFEQAQRSIESDRIRDIEAAWLARLSPDQQGAFRREVQAAQARQPQPVLDMPPGTLPNPPRPGREPREPKEASGRRSRWT